MTAVPESNDNQSKSTGPSLGGQFKSKGLIVAAGFAVSLVFLVITAYNIKWSEVGLAFQNGHWLPWLPIGLALYICGMLVRGFRLKLLVLREAKLSVMTGTNIVAVGYAINNILPLRLGEFARAGMLAERTGLPFTQCLTVTLLERLLDGIVILMLFVAGNLFFPASSDMLRIAEIAGVIFAIALGGIFVMTVSPENSVAFVSRLFMRANRVAHDRAVALVSQVIRGLSSLHPLVNALQLFLASLSIWLLEAGMFRAILWCFNIDAPFLYFKSVIVMSFTNLGILAPSSPGFVGVYHLCCKMALMAVAHGLVDESIALSYAVVVHLLFFATVTVWGVAAMAWYGMELGATASLAWQAKPLAQLPDTHESVKLLTSIAGRSAIEKAPSPFWFALTEGIVAGVDLPLSDAERTEVLNYSTDFLTGQLACLSSVLRMLMKIGMFGFFTITLLKRGRPFTDLPPKARQEEIEAWAYGKFEPARKMFRPLRSIADLAYFEHPIVQNAIDKLNAQDAQHLQDSNLTSATNRPANENV